MFDSLKSWRYWNVSGPWLETYPNRFRRFYKDHIPGLVPFSKYGKRAISVFLEDSDTKLLDCSPLECSVRTRGEDQIYFHAKWSFGRLKVWKTIYENEHGVSQNLFLNQVSGMLGDETETLYARTEKILDVTVWTGRQYEEALRKFSEIPGISFGHMIELYLKLRKTFSETGNADILSRKSERDFQYILLCAAERNVLKAHPELLENKEGPKYFSNLKPVLSLGTMDSFMIYPILTSSL